MTSSVKKDEEQESVWQEKPQTIEPLYKIDERPKTFAESILYGWQHTLVDISPFVLPLAIASQMGMSQTDGARFVNCCLFAMGISTIIQTTIGNRLPIVQGPSATHTAVIKSVAPICGPIATWFAILIGSIVEVLIGASGILKYLRKFFPISVSGCVVICIGLSLGQTAMKWTIGDASSTNLILAAMVILTILLLQTFATKLWGGILARSSIFISIWFVGLVIAGFMGQVNWSIVAEKEWFSFPILFPFGSFDFEWNMVFIGALVGILAGYIGSILESIGDYAATCAAAGEDYTIKHMNRGITAEGFACALSSFLGAMPCTSYSQNIGIISTTRIASRFVVQIAAVILICYGLCPKFGALLVAMPRPVLGAVFIVVCGMISMSGVRLLSAAKVDSSSTMVIGITLICAIAIPNVIRDQNLQLPLVLEIITKNTVVIAVVLGVLLNAFFIVGRENNKHVIS